MRRCFITFTLKWSVSEEYNLLAVFPVETHNKQLIESQYMKLTKFL